MTTLREDRGLTRCPGCSAVPGFAPECALCGGSGLVMTDVAFSDEWRLRPTIHPDHVRVVRKHPAERNREKARRRARRRKR